MSPTLERIAALLRKKKITVQNSDELGAIIASIPTDRTLYQVTILIAGTSEHLIVRVRMPLVVPETRIVQAMELIVRANLGFLQGRFDLDLATREIHAHLGTLLSAWDMDDGLIEQFIGRSLETADDWHSSFSRVLLADADPEAEAVLTADVVRLRKEASRLTAEGWFGKIEGEESGSADGS